MNNFHHSYLKKGYVIPYPPNGFGDACAVLGPNGGISLDYVNLDNGEFASKSRKISIPYPWVDCFMPTRRDWELIGFLTFSHRRFNIKIYSLFLDDIRNSGKPFEAFIQSVWENAYERYNNGDPFCHCWTDAYYDLYRAIDFLRHEGRDNETDDLLFLVRITMELSKFRVFNNV